MPAAVCLVVMPGNLDSGGSAGHEMVPVREGEPHQDISMTMKLVLGPSKH